MKEYFISLMILILLSLHYVIKVLFIVILAVYHETNLVC